MVALYWLLDLDLITGHQYESPAQACDDQM